MEKHGSKDDRNHKSGGDDFMNITMVIGDQLLPVNSGGRQVIYERIKQLHKHNIINLFIITNDSLLNYQKKELESICNDYLIVSYSNGIRRFLKALYKPYSVAKRSSKSIKKTFYDFISCRQTDLIIYEGPQVCEIGIGLSIKQVIDFHNVEFKSLDNITHSLNGLKRLFYKFEVMKLKHYEIKLYKHMNDGFIFISDDDKILFKKCFNCDGTPTLVSPAGNYSNKKEQELNQNIIIVGNMKYLPNSNGVIWFINNVYNKLNNYEGKLYVVGKNPPDNLLKLKSNNIIITGEVSDLSEYYNICSIAVVPIFNGGGIKTKLIEAASYAKLIVSTPSGIVGSKFTKSEVIICNNEEDFINFFTKYKNNLNLYSSYKNNAYKLFCDNYLWDNIMNEYNDFIKGIVNKNDYETNL